MGLIETELGNALSGPVKRKANTTGKLLGGSIRAKASRVSAGTTEVMVKITGFGKGASHVKAHIDYISRNGKLELETDHGEILAGRDEIKELSQDWQQDFGDARRHKNQRDTMHLVLSMPEHTEPDAVRDAAREFAKSAFGNHEYAFALHTDEPHPHCHLTVKMRGFDGTRLNPRKEDLQAWREGFAEKLRDCGVPAEATPRRARGVVRKAEPSVIRHIERGDKTHEPRVSKVRAAMVREAAQELAAEAKGATVSVKPWEQAIAVRQQEIRRAWLAAARELERKTTALTFNSKEARNERPDYGQFDRTRAKTTQRAAAVYQSHLRKAGRQTSAGSLARLRNLSGLTLVQHQRSAQMLLQSDAPARLGEGRTTSDEVRRPRAGDPRADSRQRLVEKEPGRGAVMTGLAQRIREYVAAMPVVVETQNQQVKRELAVQFVHSTQVTPSRGSRGTDELGRANGTEHGAPRDLHEGPER